MKILALILPFLTAVAITGGTGLVPITIYLGTQKVAPTPDLVPSTPYVTLRATAATPSGPWTKHYTPVPFDVVPATTQRGLQENLGNRPDYKTRRSLDGRSRSHGST